MNTNGRHRTRAGLTLLESILMLAVFTASMLAWRVGSQTRARSWHEEFANRIAVQQLDTALNRPFGQIASYTGSQSITTRTDGSLDSTTFNTRVQVTSAERGSKDVQCDVSWQEAVPGQPDAVHLVRLEARVADTNSGSPE